MNNNPYSALTPQRTLQAPRIVTFVFGTRPEAIKLAPVILAMRQHPHMKVRVCVTGQHRQMLDQVLDVFGIKPDKDLELMRPNQSLGELTARAISELDKYLSQDKPDLVLVQGDTTTVLCAALACFYQRIPIGHVEAGLRTGNLQAPWPEEANRILTSRLAALHFAPTPVSQANLLKESVPESSIFITGNTVVDALFIAIEKVKATPPAIPGLPNDNLSVFGQAPVVLITGHRRENFGDGFESICKAIATLVAKFPQAHFVYPVHLNPNVREPVSRILGAGSAKNLHLIEPLSYLPFVSLLNRSTVVLTDSGGIQEEAPSLGKPVLVMRETTERPEAVAAGTVQLVGTDYEKIVSACSKLLTDDAAREILSRAHNPYGDGHSTPRILAACETFLAGLKS